MKRIGYVSFRLLKLQGIILPVVMLLFFSFLAGKTVALTKTAKVVAVFDGDTVLLDSGEKVRYLGIDAPEVAHDERPADCYGEKAKEENKKLVLNRRVTLRYDREKKDKYGRLLSYVFLPDGRCVNEQLLKLGCAAVNKTAKGFDRFQKFIELQRKAVRSRRGMWGACKVTPASFYIGNRRSFIFHRDTCPYGKQTATRNRVFFDDRWSALEEGYRPCRRCKP